MSNKTQITQVPSKARESLGLGDNEYIRGCQVAKWGMVNGYDWSQKPSDNLKKHRKGPNA